MPERVAYAILFVDDLEVSIRFYRDTLGIPFRFSNETYAEFATEGAKFALFVRAALPDLIGVEVPSGPAPWPQGEVAFFVEDPDAEHAWCARGSPSWRRRPIDPGVSARRTSPIPTATS
jgi:catechol 2,3-dioxygenase-like lactoylglutathione lyase family enzyme